jgi:hypothetical protein
MPLPDGHGIFWSTSHQAIAIHILRVYTLLCQVIKCM